MLAYFEGVLFRWRLGFFICPFFMEVCCDVIGHYVLGRDFGYYMCKYCHDVLG